MAERTLVTKRNLAFWKMRVGELKAQGRLVGGAPEDILGLYVKVNHDEKFTVEIEDPQYPVGRCPKCRGTGEYVGPLSRGVCFDCGGKGWLTLRDTLRDGKYHILNTPVPDGEPATEPTE